MKNTKTFQIVMIGLTAALLCVAGPNSIPILAISPVPISFTNFAIFISAFILDKKSCTMSVLIYILLGAIGLPVFSGYTGGLGKLAGPTGGYIIGFIFTAFICAYFNTKFSESRFLSIVGMILGLSATYLFGTVWFSCQQHMDFIPALGLCVLPYLIGDALKIIAASIIGPVIRSRISKL